MSRTLQHSTGICQPQGMGLPTCTVMRRCRLVRLSATNEVQSIDLAASVRACKHAQEMLEKERRQVNSAAELEEEQDRQEAESLAIKQQQEREFIEVYLRQHRAAKLHQALDQAAEDAG